MSNTARAQKNLLHKLSEEELEILELQKTNDTAEKKVLEEHTRQKQKYLQSQYTLAAIRKNRQFLVRRLRAVQLVKIGELAIQQGQQPQPNPRSSTYAIVGPRNPTQRLVRFNVPACGPVLYPPFWRPKKN